MIYTIKLKHYFIIFCLFFLSIKISGQPLNGTYTIGGATPDYTTFTLAVNALNTNGVSGPVVFNVRSGVYVEKIKINQFTGTSTTNTVTFRSETGNRDDVVIKHTHTGMYTADNYTIYLNGTDNIIFRNITIQALPIYAGYNNNNRVLYITNASKNVVFENNNIVSWYHTNSDAKYNSCVVIGDDANSAFDIDSVYFRNNNIIGGYIGFYFNGSNSSTNFSSSGLLLDNNVFSYQYAEAVDLTKVKNARVTRNTITNDQLNYYNFTGIYASYISDSLIIEKNHCRISNGGIGINVTSVKYGSDLCRFIANNMIIMGPGNISATPIGIQSSSNKSLLIAHNSVYIRTNSSAAISFKSLFSDTITIKNNIFVSEAGGYCFYFGSGVLTSNNNNCYNGGGNLAYLFGTTYNNLAAIISGTGNESNSVYGDPLFMNNEMLIPFNPALYDSGSPLSSISSDYFGTSRSLTTPDIGPFEGTLQDTDAGISYTSLQDEMLCPGDSFRLYAKVKNYGTNVLTSAAVKFSISGVVQNTVLWSGSLLQYEESDSIYIGSFPVGNMLSFNIKVWTEDPNTVPDPFNYNDTIIFTGHTSLNGAYSVGLPGSDFPSFAAAVQALKDYGVCGPVVFNIEPGTYTVQEILPQISGASPVNTITFQSSALDSSSVTLSYTCSSSNGDFILKLDKAKHFRFRHLSFYTNGTTYYRALLFYTNADSNSVENCVFTTTTHTSTDKILHIYSSNITIRNNRFSGGGCLIYSEGTYSSMNLNLIIDNNLFNGTAKQSIFVSYHQNLYVQNNIFRGIRNHNYSDIEFKYCSGDIRFVKNDIFLTTNQGIITIENCNGTSQNPLFFCNNFFSKINLSNYWIMSVTSSSNIRIANNSFNNNLYYAATCLGLSVGVSNIDIINNIFCSRSGGNCLYFSSMPDTSSFNSENNAYFTTGTYPFRVDYSYYTYDDWNNIPGLENNSIFTDPLFYTDTNLHINNCYDLNGAGKSLPYITDDIDGDTRNAVYPDIGADEFPINMSNYFDIAICSVPLPDTSSCLLADSIKIGVTNLSTFPINTFVLKWWLFGILNDSALITQTILPGDTIYLNLGAFDFNPGTLYNFEFEVSQPNGHLDNHEIDNSRTHVYYNLDEVTILTETRPFCYGNQIIGIYIKAVPNNSVLWSNNFTGNYISVPHGTYSVTITGQNGCIVTDSITTP